MEPMTMLALGSLAGKAGGLLGGLFGGGDEKPYIPPELLAELRFDQDLNRQIGGLLGNLNNPLASPLAARMIQAGTKAATDRYGTLRTKQNVALGRKYLGSSSFANEREAALNREEGEALAGIPVNVGQFITQNLLQQLQTLGGLRTGAGRTIAGIRMGQEEQNRLKKAALWQELGGLFGGAATGGIFGGQTKLGAGRGALLGALSPDSAGLLPFLGGP